MFYEATIFLHNFLQTSINIYMKSILCIMYILFEIFILFNAFYKIFFFYGPQLRPFVKWSIIISTSNDSYNIKVLFGKRYNPLMIAS